MRVIELKSEMRAISRQWRGQGLRVALVPTMGYLHDGHLALVRQASAVADRVIVSIFVNPTQFGENEDFDQYPRHTERDLDLLRPLGVDAVFMPAAAEMYGAESQTIVDVPILSSILQGALRPAHFRGVATVVCKLFHISEPDAAIFGEKDYQQLTLIRQMADDLDMPVEIIGHSTVREADGLAMSSRNVRLQGADRQAATVLNAALDAAEQVAQKMTGGLELARLERILHDVLASEPRADVQSVDLLDAQTLQSADALPLSPVVILLAARFGDVLLIDQRVIPQPTED